MTRESLTPEQAPSEALSGRLGAEDPRVGTLGGSGGSSGPQAAVQGVAPSESELHARQAHPDWEYATTEGPRKRWYDIDVRPADEHGEPDPTWQRNTDAGIDGWERFDYTEESYWRRPKPAARAGQS
ncbi:hypothetical protein ACFWV1_13030 [Streptomyces sp. NPDC058700]|uniref:hypothetical protein n=1 Tax=Streptomyces sp. NPDC058700 TaxID=3346607 RepID=UPI003658B170